MLQPFLMPLSKPTSERKQVNPGLLHCGPKKEKRSTFHFGGLTVTIIRSGGVIFWLRLIYSNSAVNLLLWWSMKLKQYGLPAAGPALWDLGPGHCSRTTWMTEALMSRDFHPGWWAVEGGLRLSWSRVAGILLWFLCPAAVLPFVLSGNLTHRALLILHWWAAPAPWEVLAPPASPWGQVPFHFLGGHCPGLFSPGCDLGDPALDSCSQLFGA